VCREKKHTQTQCAVNICTVHYFSRSNGKSRQTLTCIVQNIRRYRPQRHQHSSCFAQNVFEVDAQLLKKRRFVVVVLLFVAHCSAGRAHWHGREPLSPSGTVHVILLRPTHTHKPIHTIVSFPFNRFTHTTHCSFSSHTCPSAVYQ